MINRALLLIFIIFLFQIQTFSQILPAGEPVLEEAIRRGQLLNEVDSVISFNIRPLQSIKLNQNGTMANSLESFSHPAWIKESDAFFTLMPIRNTMAVNSKRPMDGGMGL